MYISQILISNFRSFEYQPVELSEGINVIIGHNNSGKTNLLRALSLFFDAKNRKLSIDDFYKGIKDFTAPPEINVSIIISESEEDEVNDKDVVYHWLLTEAKPYQAKLTFSFFLPQGDEYQSYEDEVQTFKNAEGSYDVEKCWNLISKKYIQKYITRIYGGDETRKEVVDRNNLDRFDYQFLKAIRDAESQMFYGSNTILKEILNYFLDYDITEGKLSIDLGDIEKEELKRREEEFATNSNALLQSLINRISDQEILKYSEDTGADKGGVPSFDANISEKEILFALRLIVEKSGFSIPIINNGLGYNNLLYVALILAKIQMERSSFMGQNAKIFPILAIEEPEAHLHPAMQFKFLKFLKNNLEKEKQARQIFVTSHSTHITSAVDLDKIICLYDDVDNKLRVSYPGKVFLPSEEKSKRYIQRFLDATKSNLLFAEKVIFVEGLAEQLLMPCFAAYLGKEEELINQHVAVVSVDSACFKHFIKLFKFDESNDNKKYAINKKVVCITDCDPSQKEKTKSRWKGCLPVELNSNTSNYDYKPLSGSATNLISETSVFGNILIKTQATGEGKTLEYELALFNPSCNLIVTDSFPSSGKNSSTKFKAILDKYIESGSTLSDLLALSEHDDIKALISSHSSWDDAMKKRSLVASVYYQIVAGTKGEHAFFLEKNLRDNLEKEEASRVGFVVPEYIKESIEFIVN